MSDRTLNVGGRQGRGEALAHAPRTHRPNMLANPYFWYAGATSLAIWFVLVRVFFGGAAW